MTPDSDLVRRVLAGDHAAFDALVARHRSTVYRQALRRVCLPQDAEEIAQNVFLKTYVHLYQFRQEADFAAWLRTITARESISWLRAKRPSADDPDSLYETAPDSQPSPESALLDIELRQRVRNALASLPESERQVAQAFYLEGRSYNEIQDRYGLARSSVAGYLYRARQKLAHRLEGLLSLSWIPGWEIWGPTLNLTGGASTPATKAAVTVATVATVAVMSSVTPSLHRAVNPVKVKEMSAKAASTSDTGLLHRMLHPLSDRLALGERVAFAAEPSKTDPLMTKAEKDRVTFKQGNHIWRFVMENGQLFVEEGGKPRRAATPAEQTRFRMIQSDVLARTQTEQAALARVDAHLKEIDGSDHPELSEEEERRMEAAADEAQKRIDEHADALSRRMDKHSAEIERLAEEISRRAERRSGELSKRVEKRAEELSRRAERQGEEIEKHADEIEKWAEQFAEDVERQHRGNKSAQPDWKRFNSRMEQFNRELNRKLEGMSSIQEDARKMAAEATADIGPMMKDLQPLMDEMARLQSEQFNSGEMKDLHKKIQKEINSSMERVQRDLQRSRRDVERAKARADRENTNAERDRDKVEEDKAKAEDEKAKAAEDQAEREDAEREKAEESKADADEKKADEAEDRDADE